jgi:tetratricopeptide (TPR) repeat protein
MNRIRTTFFGASTILVFLLLSTLVPLLAQGLIDAERQLKHGISLMARGRIDNAVEEFLKIILVNPDYIPAYVNLCSAYRQKGHFEKALAVLGKAKELDPKNFAVHFQLGAVYLDVDKFYDAAKEFRTAIEINPTDADALANLGLALAQDGNIQNALPYFRKSLSINPNSPSTRKSLGYAYALVKNWHAAIDELLRARACDAAYPGVEETLCAILQKALKDLDAARRNNPRDPRAHYYYAYAVASNGKWQEALDEIEKGIELNGLDSDFLKAKGLFYLKQEKLKQAEAAYRACIEKDASDWDCYKTLSIVYIRMDKPKQGLEAALRAIDSNPNVIGVQAALGVAYAENYAQEKALAAFQRAVSLGGSNPTLYFNLAVTNFLLYKYDASWEYARRAEYLGEPEGSILIKILKDVSPEPN